MRIVGGRHRGRKLVGPPDRRIRPTSDRAREALFAILEHRVPPVRGGRFLDLCAGTGAVGLEAFSRGASDVLLIENDPTALGLIRRNRALLGDPPEVRVRAADATALPPATEPFDLAFLDPPYGAGLAIRILERLRAGWLRAGALVIVESPAGRPLAPPEGLAVLDERRYGAGRFLFLRTAPGSG